MILLVLACAGCAAQSPETLLPSPLGRMVDVGGYRVHIYCTGTGSPTVFIVGSGFSFDWGLVQPEIARFTRVCTYDPSGTAWSAPGPVLTCLERVHEIHKLLDKAGIEGPYVLAGLSIGALVARLYASEYPSEVAGMVIIDHAFIPDDNLPHAKPSPSNATNRPPALIFQTPILLTVEGTSNFSKLPLRLQELHRWAVSRNPVLPTVDTAEDCLSQLKAKSHSPHELGNIPLIVVSTGNEARGYLDLQNEILSLSSNSLQVIADKSFHSVEIDQPEVATQAIRQVVEAVRKGITKSSLR